MRKWKISFRYDVEEDYNSFEIEGTWRDARKVIVDLLDANYDGEYEPEGNLQCFPAERIERSNRFFPKDCGPGPYLLACYDPVYTEEEKALNAKIFDTRKLLHHLEQKRDKLEAQLDESLSND